MAGRELERDEVEDLLETGSVGPLEGFRSKLGRPFTAAIKIDGEFKQAFDFGDDANGNGAAIDFSTLPAIAPCPVCKSGTVHDTGNAYQCSNTPKCKFRMGKTICQREVPREQVLKLIETGKTDLIPRFISKKGKPFSAFLKLEGDKVGFEFEERKPAAKKPVSKTRTPPRLAASVRNELSKRRCPVAGKAPRQLKHRRDNRIANLLSGFRSDFRGDFQPQSHLAE